MHLTQRQITAHAHEKKELHRELGLGAEASSGTEGPVGSLALAPCSLPVSSVLDAWLLDQMERRDTTMAAAADTQKFSMGHQAQIEWTTLLGVLSKLRAEAARANMRQPAENEKDEPHGREITL